jgi:amino acid adenylation domain-containing protein
MLFHSLYDRASSAYFEQMSYRFHGFLDINIFRKSLNEVVKRYDILRTAFVNKEADRPVQVVLKEREPIFGFEDISGLDSSEAKEERVEKHKIKDKENLFDLTKDVLFRVAVFKIGQEEYEIIWTYHHILMDGWCTDILTGELWKIYEGFIKNKPCRLPPVTQFREYIKWLGKVDKKSSEKYWQIYLDEYNEAVKVPTMSEHKSSNGKYKNEFFYHIIDSKKTNLLQKFAGKNSVTLNTIFQSAWGILLGSYNGVRDVVYGAVVSGRPSDIPGVEAMVGIFVNTIPVRIKFTEDEKFTNLLARVQKEAVESERHHHYPLADIQSESELKQDLLDHIFVFENYPVAKRIKESMDREGGDGKVKFGISRVDIRDQTNYDFNLILIPGEQVSLKFHYNSLVYKEKNLKRVALHLDMILDQVIMNEELRIKELKFLPEQEKKQILDEFNNINGDPPDNKTIIELFEEQVEKTPEAAALRFEEKEMTYRELNGKANRLAGLLREKGVKPGDVVGLMVEPSFDAVIGITGILKSGGAYLPIDPEYPENRISAMLPDCGVSILVTEGKVLNKIPITSLRTKKHGKIEPLVTPAREQIKDFNALAKPDRTLIDYGKYHRHIGIAMAKHTVSIQGTRGCPYNCAYCHKIWPKTHFVRTSENIFEEVLQCYKSGVRKFTFVDDIFNLDATNSARFFEKIIKKKLDVEFFFPNGVRTDILTTEYIDMMMEAGLTNMAMALESASPRLQKLIRKNLNVEKFASNVRYIAEKYPGMISEIFMMIGFPTETEEEALQTLELVESFKWIHFPDLFVLKIFPNTDMYDLAVENGVSKELIERSVSLAYHDIPETIPFSKGFVRQYQARYMNEYFLNRERLKYVLPLQMKTLSEDEIVQKYDSYLPMDIKSFPDILKLAELSMADLGGAELIKDEEIEDPEFNKRIRKYFPVQKKSPDAFRVLLMDTSLLFKNMSEELLYDMIEEPLGLLYLMTYLNEKFAGQISGKVVKSRIDFDSFEELKSLISDFKPDLIGIRTLSIYKKFFHTIIFQIRQWGFDVPIIAGGPYATSDYNLLLQDDNVDLAVLGEGELTIAELVEKMMQHNRRLPGEEVLAKIDGIAFIKDKDKALLKELSRDIIQLDRAGGEIDKFSPENLNKVNSDSDLLYVIHTSGSTGTPKGVMLEHRNLVNLIRHQYNHTNINFESVLQFITLTFDVSFQEIYSTLLAGGTLSLVNREKRLDLPSLFNVIKENGIKTLFLPASFVKFIFNEDEYIDIFPRNVEHLVTAGEQIIVTDKFKRYLKENSVYLHNHYGPAETHVVTALTIDPKGDIPTLPSIGKPLINTAIYILNKSMNLQPIGVTGELYIGGVQVGRGYLGKEALTRDSYIDNPFVKDGRLYRTGDQARWLADGNIEFLGRIDHQVKIRGFRVELGEIESRLMAVDTITEAVVVARQERGAAEEENTGQKYLCAYAVADEKIEFSEVKEILTRNLPDYMVPEYFVQLKEIPLTSHGKIDRRALPDPKGEMNRETAYEAPTNEDEEKIIGIWADVLGLEPQSIGINDNFFDLGGNSLNILKANSRLNKAFPYDISISSLFLYKTAGELAANIKEEGLLSRLECIVKMNKGGNKKNLFIFHPMHGMVYQYRNMAKLLENERNVYAIQTRGLVRNSYIPETFDLMVADYTQQILQVQKEGVFTIAAFCVGDLIAYKAVKLLEDLGHTVDHFIMIDEPVFIPELILDYYRFKDRLLGIFGKSMKSLYKLLTKKHYQNKYAKLYYRMEKEIEEKESAAKQKTCAHDDSEEDVEEMKTKAKIHQKFLMEQYLTASPFTRMTGRIKAHISNIKAELTNEPNLDVKLVRKMSSGRGVMPEIPGTHHNIFDSPQVDRLVEVMRDMMKGNFDKYLEKE